MIGTSELAIGIRPSIGSSTHSGFAPQGKFPNFYEIRVYDKDDDGDYDLVPDKIANWGAGPNLILQDLYWENTGGQFVRREN